MSGTISNGQRTAAPKRWSVRSLLLLGLGVLPTLAALALAKDLSTYDLLYTTVSLSTRSLTRTDEFYDDHSGFVHSFWDGPTVAFSHGDTYGFKVGRRLLRLDFVCRPTSTEDWR